MANPFLIQLGDTSQSDGNMNSVKSEYEKRGASAQMLNLLDGLKEPGDCCNTTDVPPWLDINLFNKGRLLYQKWLVSMYISNFFSLVVHYNLPRSLRVLIFTQNSDTPLKAFKRFLSTVKHLMIWENGDIWDSNDKAYHDLQFIRKVHNRVSAKVNSDNYYTEVNAVQVPGMDQSGSACPMNHIIRDDFQKEKCNFIALENKDNPALYINQFDMAITQWAFMGLMVAHPKKMGCHYGKDEEFEAMIHFWRAIGYLLGIDDRYNFCKGSLKQVRELCQEFEQLILVPHLSVVDNNYEVMATAVSDGISMMVRAGPGYSFPAMFYYCVTDVLGKEAPIFAAHMSMWQKLQYWHLRFLFDGVLSIPGADEFCSKFFRLGLKRIIREQDNGVKPRNVLMWTRLLKFIFIALPIVYFYF